MKNSLLKKVTQSLKIALAALLAIALAGKLGLEYSATAGIITILSIQNTKLETVKTAGKRALAFAWALVIGGSCYGLMGYTLWAFAVYLFLFAMVCLVWDWPQAIAMDSVLISHFLSQGCFWPQLGNEVLLFVIGTGFGILVNLHLRSHEDRFTKSSDLVDQQIKEILGRMAMWLVREDKSGYDGSCFDTLQEALQQAEACAVENYGNASLFRNVITNVSRDRLFHASEEISRGSYELDYVRMRQQQTVILRAVYDNIRGITYLPKQTGQVAELLGQIQQEYHRYNNVEGLLEQLQALLADMQTQPLPQSREEFEARAVLFYILKQLEELLELKREFIQAKGAENDAEFQTHHDV